MSTDIPLRSEAGFVVTWKDESDALGICARGDTLSAALHHLADSLTGGGDDGKPYVFVVHTVGADLMDALRVIQVENPDL